MNLKKEYQTLAINVEELTNMLHNIQNSILPDELDFPNELYHKKLQHMLEYMEIIEQIAEVEHINLYDGEN